MHQVDDIDEIVDRVKSNRRDHRSRPVTITKNIKSKKPDNDDIYDGASVEENKEERDFLSVITEGESDNTDIEEPEPVQVPVLLNPD